jgi:hypothetical protein
MAIWKLEKILVETKLMATWRAPFTHPVVASLDHPLFRCAAKRVRHFLV